jgi:hypothetical protein
MGQAAPPAGGAAGSNDILNSLMNSLIPGSTTAPAPGGAPATPTPPPEAAPAPAAPAGAPPVPAAVVVPPPGVAESAIPAPAGPPVEGSLQDEVDTYWHYGKMARYDLASTEGKAILDSNPEPRNLLETFETVANNRHDNLDEWLLRWQGVAPMKDVTTQLLGVLAKGHYARRNDPSYIQQTIERMAVSDRAYLNSIGRLRDSGELAVPVMLDILRDAKKAALHPTVRHALRDLGRVALNPLLAATDMKDATTLVSVITALGDIGYDTSVPYLTRLATDSDRPQVIHVASARALQLMGASAPQAAELPALFYALAGKFYYRNSAVVGTGDTGYIWNWDEEKGLQRKDVPLILFGDIMAMRECLHSLQANPQTPASISLWLAANTRRQTDLPAGATDATRTPDEPDARFYNVSAGIEYLNPALSRALHDRDPALAFQLTQAITEIVGQANLVADPNQPVVAALSFPDRLVRYEAAMGLAESLPSKSFAGQERVVPLLAEALAQTGKTNVLILESSQDKLNGMQADLSGQGFVVTGGTTVDSAVDAARVLPAVDVVILSGDLDPAAADRMLLLSSQTIKLASAAKLVLAGAASPLAARSVTDPQVTLANGLSTKDAIDAARKRAGLLMLDDKLASDYAIRAAHLLGKLTISRTQVLDLAPAHDPLLMALADPRPELVAAAGDVLAVTPGKDVPAALLAHSLDDKLVKDVRISLFHNIAASSKIFGNQLGATDVDSLQKEAQDEKDPALKDAAAEALGALNLPPNHPAKMILDHG